MLIHVKLNRFQQNILPIWFVEKIIALSSIY